MTETEKGSIVQFFVDANVEQASSSEPQQVEMLQVQSVEPESSSLEHKEQSWWSSVWMMEAIAEEAETSAVVQLFLEMLEREHQVATVQDTSLRQSVEQDPLISAQLCVSSMTDS